MTSTTLNSTAISRWFIIKEYSGEEHGAADCKIEHPEIVKNIVLAK